MKQTFLLFAFLAFVISVNAQITLERADYTREIDVPTFSWGVLNPDQVAIPTEGPDQVWDYSQIVNGAMFSLGNLGGTSPDVPTANISYNSTSPGGIPGIPIIFDVTWYERLDDDSRSTVGRLIYEQSLSLTAFTGGPSDSLLYLNTLSVYEEPSYKVRFPLNYGDSWTTDMTLENDFLLNLPAFGLSYTPGANPIESHTEVEVVGWGKLLLPNLTDGSVLELDAILAKHERTITSNWEIGGAPAPQALLDAFGLQQGTMNNFSTYRFWVKGLPRAALYIETIAGVVDDVHIAADIESLISSTSDLEKRNETFRTFPNPASSGEILNIQSENIPAEGAISLLDLTGRTLTNQHFEAHSNQNIQLSIPANLSHGLYLYQVHNETGQLIGAGKVHIQ